MDGKHVERTVSEGAGKPKVTPIQIAAITLSSVAIVGMGIMFLTKEKVDSKSESPAVQKIGMETGIVTNEDDAADIDIGEPFTFTTLYNRDIYITNGKEATCYIGNDASNYYEDMYIQIYLNDENGGMGEEIYVSQIIPRGSHIESFTANRDLEPGNYEGTLVHSNVDESGGLVGDTPVIVDIHVAE